MAPILVLFTYGVSLKTWDESGNLEREIRLYNQMADRGLSIIFMTYGDEEDFRYQHLIPKITIVPVYKKCKRSSLRIMRLLHSLWIPFFYKDLFRSAQLIKTKQIFGGWVAIIAKKAFGKKVLLRCGYEPNRFAIKQGLSWVRRAFLYLTSSLSYKGADHIVVATMSDQQYIVSRFKLDSKKISIIPNWVDTDLFAPDRNVQKKKRTALFVGRLEPQKNLDKVWEAASQAKIKLEIAGTGSLESFLQRKAVESSTEVSFLGRVANSQLPFHMNSCSLFVLCSHYEGNPKALLEAMSCGCLVLATAVDGMKELIEHKVTGYLVNVDAHSIASGMKDLAENESKYADMRIQAREFIVHNYSLDSAINKELDIYEAKLSAAIAR